MKREKRPLFIVVDTGAEPPLAIMPFDLDLEANDWLVLMDEPDKWVVDADGKLYVMDILSNVVECPKRLKVEWLNIRPEKKRKK